MKSATKKNISIFFLLPGFIPWLFILTFCIKQQTIRHLMEEKLEQNIPSHRITIATNEVVWIKKGKEILVNGKLFDIKAAESANGFTTFTGLYDEDETWLKKQFAESWQKKSSGDNKTLLQFIVSLQNVFFEDINTGCSLQKAGNCYSPFDNADLPVNFELILTPPPRA